MIVDDLTVDCAGGSDFCPLDIVGLLFRGRLGTEEVSGSNSPFASNEGMSRSDCGTGAFWAFITLFLFCELADPCATGTSSTGSKSVGLGRAAGLYGGG